MNSHPKAGGRKENRIQIRGECRVHPVNSAKIYAAEIHDISSEGMSFNLKERVFAPKSLIEIKIRTEDRPNLPLLGIVIEISENSPYRYSVKFDHRLNEKVFKEIVLTFRPYAFDAWS